MKLKQRLPNCLPAIVVFITACIALNAVAADGKLITVLNPGITEKLADRVPLAPRLDTLENKTIYIVDMNYEGILGTPVLGEIKAWFEKNMPGVNVILKLKKGSYVDDDAALWKEIAANKGNGVILGVAG
jgi:hypothetical protein